MADNGKTLAAYFPDIQVDTTEKFLERIVVLALDAAGFLGQVGKTGGLKKPTNDTVEKLTEAWTKKLYTVARKNTASETDVTDKEIKEFQNTVDKWGKSLGKTVVETLGKVILASKKEDPNESEVKADLKNSLNAILSKWKVDKQSKIYEWVTGYSDHIKKISDKLDKIDIAPKEPK